MGDQATAAAAMKLKVTAIPMVSALGRDKEVDDLEVLVRMEAPPSQVVVQHPPIDLVAVVDVSGSMGWLPDQNKKCGNGQQSRMDYLKAALRFIIDKLKDDDRLSIIQFNGSVKDSSPLSPISGDGRESAHRLVDNLIPDGGTSFKPALEKAVDILDGRGEDSSRRVPFIFFLSDGEESDGAKTQWDLVMNAHSNNPLQKVLRKYPVHTFGFSNFHDPKALLAIARVSCGTYSYIDGQGLHKITDAFAVCLGGLSTVVIKDATIALSATPGVTIVSIDSGGYQKSIEEDGASGKICIPMLYEGEVKNFIVHLRVPRAADEEEQLLLTTGGTYVDAAAGHGATIAKDHQLTIQRTTAGGGEGQQRDKAVLEQVTLFKLLSLLEELVLKGKELRKNGGKSAHSLSEEWSKLKDSSSVLSNNFDQDVEEIVRKLREGSGQSFVYSYVSSHQMQRPTIMGSPESTIVAGYYETVAITSMAKEAATHNPAPAPVTPNEGANVGIEFETPAALDPSGPANGHTDVVADQKPPPPEQEATPMVEELNMRVTTVPIVSALGHNEEADDLEVLVRVEAPQQVVAKANKHPPIDLIAVVDVSGSMGWLPDQNKKCENGEPSRMDYLKAALRFIVKELHDDDRLSIVQFNESVKDSSALLPISGGGRESARQLVDSLTPDGGTAFKPALEKAVSILQDRDEESSSKRMPFIIFLSDGEESPGFKTEWDQMINADSNHPLRKVLGKYPVHTFGFSNFHDPMALLAIARVSCGTYSYIDGKGLNKITDAFAVCLGGLSTVVVKDATIALSAAPGVTIVGIDSGGYSKRIKEDGASGEVCIPVLYEDEVKNFIVHLRVPCGEAAGEQVLLHAGGTYFVNGSASTTTTTGENNHQLSIQRPASGEDQLRRDEDVLKQVTRFKLLSLLEKLPKDKELRSEGGKWAEWLKVNWSKLKISSSLSSSSFDKDVVMMVRKLEEGSGQAYVCSYVSSHQMERATTMGGYPGNNTIAADYKTRAMKKIEDKAVKQREEIPNPRHMHPTPPVNDELYLWNRVCKWWRHATPMLQYDACAFRAQAARMWKSVSGSARTSCGPALGVAGVVVVLVMLMLLLRLLGGPLAGGNMTTFNATLAVVKHPQWPAMKDDLNVTLGGAKEERITSFFKGVSPSEMSQQIEQYLYMAIVYAAVLRARYNTTEATVPETTVVRSHAQAYLQGLLKRIKNDDDDALTDLQLASEHQMSNAMSQHLYSTIVQAQVLVTMHRPPLPDEEVIKGQEHEIHMLSTDIVTLNTQIDTLTTDKATLNKEIATLKIQIEEMQNCCQLAKRCEQHVKELGGSADYFGDYVKRTTYTFEFDHKELSAQEAVEHGRQKIKELGVSGAGDDWDKVDGLQISPS